MPRYAVLPGHEYKAFIPYTKVFLVDPPKKSHIYLNATITGLRPNHITLSKSFPELGFPDATIPFDYAIYALGSHLPPSLDLWKDCTTYHGSKAEGCAWLQGKQKEVEGAPTVLVVGGGALGIQFATDIKCVYPEKKVTLLHSRLRLLPRFDEKMHDEILSTCKEIGIELILGERLDLDSIEEGSAKLNAQGQKVVRTVTGREIAADLLMLCTGQVPNTQLLKAMDPSVINESNHQVRVLRTLQLASAPAPVSETNAIADSMQELKVTESDSAPIVSITEPIIEEEKSPYPHIFAVGDAADAFGAIAAGHNAYSQAELAAKNIIKLIAQDSEPKSERQALDRYTAGPPAIKVSLGLRKSVYQLGPTIGVKTDGHDDLQAAAIWPFFGLKVEKDEDMRV
ncbi:hypothetical protein CVT24_012658 [Panaeolus cyanescens]|uniref:FAD/NAD(P)-binding domain-containing protein n=1 Tax=Panaeolus cyanescens TaxID=181874 RepID=A0A409W2E2_9AGAR|nr:hypothetical protein CVT24_012658 [Panaeolus cyanescens]